MSGNSPGSANMPGTLLVNRLVVAAMSSGSDQVVGLASSSESDNTVKSM